MRVNATEDRNEELIHHLYYLAEAATKNAAQFVSLFAETGYFYNVADGQKYYRRDIGVPVDVYPVAFPAIHRELESFYFDDNVVVVELSLNGTHNGDLATTGGILQLVVYGAGALSIDNRRSKGRGEASGAVLAS